HDRADGLPRRQRRQRVLEHDLNFTSERAPRRGVAFLPGDAIDTYVPLCRYEIEKRERERRLARPRLAAHAERFAGRQIEVGACDSREMSAHKPAPPARQGCRILDVNAACRNETS